MFQISIVGRSLLPSPHAGERSVCLRLNHVIDIEQFNLFANVAFKNQHRCFVLRRANAQSLFCAVYALFYTPLYFPLLKVFYTELSSLLNEAFLSACAVTQPHESLLLVVLRHVAKCFSLRRRLVFLFCIFFEPCYSLFLDFIFLIVLHFAAKGLVL